MDPALKYISTDLLGPPGQTEWKTLPATHSQKTVLYSVFGEAIKGVLRAYPWMLDGPWHVVAMIFNVVVSNCPQHFFNELHCLAVEPTLLGQPIDKYSPSQFCVALYDRLFWAKEHAVYETVPRRQPSHNSRGTPRQVVNSFLALGRCFMEIIAVGEDTVNDGITYYHSKAVAHLCQSCPDQDVDFTTPNPNCGVLGAGPLIAQELLGVGGTIRFLPYGMTTEAQLGGKTATYGFLRDLPGSPFRKDNPEEASNFWMTKLADLTKCPKGQMEESTCKWKQKVTGTEGRFKDSFPPGIPVSWPDSILRKILSLYPCGKIQEAEKLPIVTKFGFQKENRDNFPGSPEYWIGRIPRYRRPPKPKTKPFTKCPPTPKLVSLKKSSPSTMLQRSTPLPRGGVPASTNLPSLPPTDASTANQHDGHSFDHGSTACHLLSFELPDRFASSTVAFPPPKDRPRKYVSSSPAQQH